MLVYSKKMARMIANFKATLKRNVCNIVTSLHISICGVGQRDCWMVHVVQLEYRSLEAYRTGEDRMYE